MKSIPVSFLLAFCLLMGFLNSMAQNALDLNYTPPQSSILGSEQAGKTTNANNSEINNNNIRLNVSNLFRANLIFTYERVIFRNFSIIGGLGKPYGLDYIQLMSYQMQYEDELIVDNNSEVLVSYTDIVTNSALKSGFIGSFALRLYSDNYFNGFYYYELGGKNVARTLQWKAPNEIIVTNTHDYNVVNETNNISTTSWFFNIGRHWNSENGKINFNHELSVGCGVKITKWSIYGKGAPIIFDANYSPQGVYTLIKTDKTAKIIIPNISLTYSIGFGW